MEQSFDELRAIDQDLKEEVRLQLR